MDKDTIKYVENLKSLYKTAKDAKVKARIKEELKVIRERLNKSHKPNLPIGRMDALGTTIR